MKKLGLIGGVGPASTIPYYSGIVYGVQKRLNRPFFPNLVIESLSSFEVIRMSSAGDPEGLAAYLLGGIRNLAAAGAEVGALCCNTGHMVFNELQEASPIPLISIVEVTKDEALKRGYKKVALLGTAATMECSFFKEPFAGAGIEVEIPTALEREYVADKIVNELELEIIKDETAKAFISIVDRLASEMGAEALVLGCTELPLLFRGRELPIPVLDTMELHIEALINAVLSD